MRKVTQVVGVTAGALLLLGLGAGIGGAGQRTVTVEKTPASCVDALATAAQSGHISAEITTLAAQAVTAARYGDADTLGTLSTKVEALTAQYDPLIARMAALEQDCESKQ